MKIIDLTKPIKEYPGDPKPMKVKIKHKAHSASLRLLSLFGLAKKYRADYFQGWSDDKIVKMGVHAVTHVDAPWHYSPTTNGKRSRTIDEIELENFVGPGVVLDFRNKKDMEIITADEIKQEIAIKNLNITQGTIVLIQTGNDCLIGTKEYMSTGTGMSAEATKYLIGLGVRLMGIDQWGWDLPLAKEIQRIRAGIDSKDKFWEGHLVGIEHEYYHIEQIVNLDKLPSYGFQVIGMPLPLVGCSASPIRLVAILD